MFFERCVSSKHRLKKKFQWADWKSDCPDFTYMCIVYAQFCYLQPKEIMINKGIEQDM